MELKGVDIMPLYVDLIKPNLISLNYRVEPSDDYFTTYYQDTIVNRTKSEYMAWIYAEMHKTIIEANKCTIVQKDKE